MSFFGLMPVSPTPGGTVVSPYLSADNELVRFDGTSGQVLQPSGIIIDDGRNVSGINSLTVNTLIATVTVSTSDNIIVLNDDVVGVPSENAGVEVERGTSTNAQILWNETLDRWQCGLAGSLNTILFASDLPAESDPVFSASAAFGITSGNISNWNSKEPAIATGTVDQYWRGDKTWQTLPIPSNENILAGQIFG